MRRYGTDSEEEFLGDKEDLDRFKIPISGVSCEVDPSLLGNPLKYDIDEVGKRYRHRVKRGKTVFLKFSYNKSSILFFSFDISIKFKILVFPYAIYNSIQVHSILRK